MFMCVHAALDRTGLDERHVQAGAHAVGMFIQRQGRIRRFRKVLNPVRTD
jgi:hypothetical protein